jgi:hypothetical protein
MMAGFYTYLHCKPNGDTFYVGKGHGNRFRVFAQRGDFHANVVAKYGAKNIKVFVFPCDSEQQAFDDEVQQIAQLRRDGFRLANHTDGGEGASGRKLPEESIRKMSESHKGQPAWNKGVSMSAEFCAMMSKKLTGKKQSAETIKKRFASRSGYKHSEETKARISASHNGKKMSAEAIEKMRRSKIGVTYSAERNEKLSQALKGKPWSAARREAENKRKASKCQG